VRSDGVDISDGHDQDSCSTLVVMRQSVLHELRSSKSLGTGTVFHILETLLLPDICIVEVGGSHNLSDWESWAQNHRPPARSSSGDIMLAPLLRNGQWCLLHLDCKKREAFYHNPGTKHPDPQSMDIFRAIVRTYANQDPSDWQVEVNVKVIWY
jgi:hypothetical protein